ncbi:MAG: hypothetical protein AB8B50_18060 [Pirellulaceae bacterium]
MRLRWLFGLALTLGLLNSMALGQYPTSYDNFGASSFPVRPGGLATGVPQVPQGFNAQQPTSYGIAGPYQGQYQLATAQTQIYGSQTPMPSVPAPAMGAPAQHAQNVVPAQTHAAPMTMSPTPMVHQHAPAMQSPGMTTMAPSNCSTCNTMPSTTVMAAPMMQSVAPNCSTCGPAPISQGYTVAPNYNYAPMPVAQNSHVGLGGLPTGAKPWFFGTSGLVFNRVDSKNIPLSFTDAGYSPDILTTRDARMSAAAGFEGTIGRYFNCGKNALAVSYWGVFPSDQTVTRANSTAGGYRSRIPFTYLTMAGTPAAPTTPYPVYDWYDAAFTHQLTRSFDYQNVEINLIGFAAGCAARNFNMSTAGTLFSGTRNSGRGSCGYCGGAGCGSCSSSCAPCGTSCNTCAPSKYATGPCNLTPPRCGSRLNMSWFAGLRWFRFQDNLLYAASLDDTVVNRAADDLYYEVNATNNLVGFQTGGRFDFCVAKRVNLFGSVKAGIYNNRSNLNTWIGTDFATAYLDDTRTPTNPNNNVDYRFDENKDTVAFLTELGTGVGYRVSPKWTINSGYRVVVASGVATSPDNVRNSFANYDDVRDYDTYGTLLLHGFSFGAMYNY